jgi:hypothetical protein
MKIDYKRQIQKIRTLEGATPSIGPTDFHQDRDENEQLIWTPDNIYPGELILNTTDNKLWIGGSEEPIEILTQHSSGGSGGITNDGGTLNNNAVIDSESGIHTYWGDSNDPYSYFSLTTDNDNWNESGFWCDKYNFETFADGYNKVINMTNYYSDGGIVIQNSSNESPGIALVNSHGNIYMRSKNFKFEDIFQNDDINFLIKNLPTYTNNSDAITGGLETDQVYKTSTGELRIVV